MVVVVVCVFVKQGRLSGTEGKYIFQLLCPISLPSHRAGEAKSSLFISISGLFPISPPASLSLSLAATEQCKQDHPNIICMPQNEVDGIRHEKCFIFSPFKVGSGR